jgi:hypothetical protein
MNAGPGLDERRWTGHAEYLSSIEERVLSDMRDLVGLMRDEGRPNNLQSLTESIGRAGALVVVDGDDPARFSFQGTCFSIRQTAEGQFEIRFHFGNP